MSLVAWRVKTPEAVPCARQRRLARRRRSDLPLLQSLACSSSPGLACLVYIATYVVLYAKRKNTNSDTVDTYSIAELEASGIHILEASCVPSSDIGLHHQISLVYCDSYETSHRTMDSTACWNMPLAGSRNSCRHYTARPLLCWCIQSSLWSAGSRKRWG